MTEKESPELEISKIQDDILARLLSDAENIMALHGKELSQVFSDEESIRSFIEALDETNFIDLLNGVNGIIQGKDRQDWTMANGNVSLTMAGKDEGLPGYVPPLAQDRQMLFVDVHRAMKEMAINQRTLEDIAILLSSSINAIHAYTDANGRTSRLLYLLLTKGLNQETESAIKQAVSEDGRDIIDINPGKIEKELQSALIQRINFKRPIGSWESEKRSSDIAFNENLPDKLRSELLEMLADVTYSSIALHRYLHDKPEIEKYIKNYPQQEVVLGGQTKTLPERNNVKVDDLFQDLNEDQAREILSIYRQTKTEMTQLLIDSIAHPEKADYTDEQGATILDKFKQKIERDSKVEL